MVDNLSKLFDTSIRVASMSPFDTNAVWPHGIEISIMRVPIRKRDGYDPTMMTDLAKKLKDHTAINGAAFLICYAPMEAKARPFEVADSMVKAGFNHIDNIIIEKSWYPGKRSEVNLVNSHEYVFHFVNGNVWKLDRAPLRKYLRTPSELSCPGTVWKVITGSLDESYPLDLAELLIRMTDVLPGSSIFDPFMGTAATLKACLKLGHSFCGFEQDAKRMKRYDDIIAEHKKKIKVKG